MWAPTTWFKEDFVEMFHLMLQAGVSLEGKAQRGRWCEFPVRAGALQPMFPCAKPLSWFLPKCKYSVTTIILLFFCLLFLIISFFSKPQCLTLRVFPLPLAPLNSHSDSLTFALLKLHVRVGRSYDKLCDTVTFPNLIAIARQTETCFFQNAYKTIAMYFLPHV